MIDYTLILQKFYPKTEWSLNGDDYDGLTWLDNTPKPSKKELDSKWEDAKNLILKEEKNKQATLDSAIAKLAKLGLTEDEAKAIIGLQ